MKLVSVERVHNPPAARFPGPSPRELPPPPDAVDTARTPHPPPQPLPGLQSPSLARGWGRRQERGPSPEARPPRRAQALCGEPGPRGRWGGMPAPPIPHPRARSHLGLRRRGVGGTPGGQAGEAAAASQGSRAKRFAFGSAPSSCASGEKGEPGDRTSCISGAFAGFLPR